MDPLLTIVMGIMSASLFSHQQRLNLVPQSNIC